MAFVCVCVCLCRGGQSRVYCSPLLPTLAQKSPPSFGCRTAICLIQQAQTSQHGCFLVVLVWCPLSGNGRKCVYSLWMFGPGPQPLGPWKCPAPASSRLELPELRQRLPLRGQRHVLLARGGHLALAGRAHELHPFLQAIVRTTGRSALRPGWW